MLVKDSVQTPATHDVTEEEPEPLDQVQHSKYRSSSCKMFVPQSRSSGHNVHRERVMSQDVKPHATEPYQVEEAGQIFETRGTMEASVQLWKNSRTSGGNFRFRLGRLESHTLTACTHKQKIIARRSAEVERYPAACGASESKGIVSLLKDLGYEMKPVLAIDAKATEHFLHRQGIGRLKHIDVAYLWMPDLSDPRGCECTQSRVRKTWQTSAPNRSAKQ